MKTSNVPDSVNIYELHRHLKGLKICRISTVPLFMVSHLKSQVEYLKGKGMQVVLVSSAGPEWSMISAGKGLSVKIINIPRSLKPMQDFIALIRLTQFFMIHRFDIAHSTTPKAGLLTAIAAFISGIPVRLHTFTGQPWITLKGIMRWSSRSADKLIGVLNTKCYADSKSQEQFLVDEGIVSSRKIAVIGKGSISGVDTIRFSPARWSLSEKHHIRQSVSIALSAKIVIFVGRISPDKGIKELISAFHELLRMNYNVDLLLVGPYEKDCEGKSSTDIIGAKQCSRVHFIGYTECPEKYLAIADIFCLPSYREGFGTVVIEAAAMGIPTVGTNIYGITDAVVDGETGILVPPRNEKVLYEALKHMLDHPDELEKMGKAARLRCVQHFDANKVNEKVAEEYLNILRIKKIHR